MGMGSLQVGTKPQSESEYKKNINESLNPRAEGENAHVYRGVITY